MAFPNIVRAFPDHLEVEVTGIHQTGPQIMICSPEDTELLKHKWRLTPDGYVVSTIDRKTKRFHRLIFPNIPVDSTVDHIDRNRLNNTRANLRIVNIGIQNKNKVGKQEKELPPGIVLHSSGDSYQVMTTTSSSKVGGSQGAAASSSQEKTRDTMYFGASQYGRRGSLKAAMTARMQQMITDEQYVAALFPIGIVNKALKEVAAPELPVGAPIPDLQIALGALKQLGYNLWQIPYGGKFAKYMEKEDWSMTSTRKYVFNSIAAVLSQLEETLTGDELKSECIKLECDMRALNYLYTVTRRARKDQRKPENPAIAPLVRTLDESLSTLRSAAMPSEEEKRKKEEVKMVPTIDAAIQIAREELGGKGKEQAKESGKVMARETVREEVGETTASVMAKAMELAGEGKEEEVQAAMQVALRKLEKAEKGDEKKVKVQRVMHVAPVTETWVREHVVKRTGAMTATTTIPIAFGQWALRNGVMSPDGPLKVNQAVRAAGFDAAMKKVYVDCELKSDAL